jgi:hypothetical protein
MIVAPASGARLIAASREHDWSGRRGGGDATVDQGCLEERHVAAVLESCAGTTQHDQVGCVHSAPAVLCQLEGRRDSGGAGAGSLRDPLLGAALYTAGEALQASQ